MQKKWLIASYKKKDVKRVKINLANQNFDYYLPKITIKNSNTNPKEEVLFPGYIFIYTSLENYSSLKYTLGIKNIIKFGDHIPHLSFEEIEEMHRVEERSKKYPVVSHIKIGQNVIIANGSLKGIAAKVCSLPSKERVDILLTFLGSLRRVSISEKDLVY